MGQAEVPNVAVVPVGRSTDRGTVQAARNRVEDREVVDETEAAEQPLFLADYAVDPLGDLLLRHTRGAGDYPVVYAQLRHRAADVGRRVRFHDREAGRIEHRT